jgi:hypothetical protein
MNTYAATSDVNVWVPAVHAVANLEVVDRWYEEAGYAVPASGLTDNGATVLYRNAKFTPTGAGRLQMNAPGIYLSSAQLASCNLDSGIEVAGSMASLDIGSSALGVRGNVVPYSCVAVGGGFTVTSFNLAGSVVGGGTSPASAAVIATGTSTSSVEAANLVGCQGLGVITALTTGSGTVVANVIDGTGFFAAALQSGFTSPPVSGTAYTSPSANSVSLYQSVTLNPSATNTATVTLSISPDGLTFTQVAELQIPANAGAWAGQIDLITALVPPGWSYMFTATNATLGALVAVG